MPFLTILDPDSPRHLTQVAWDGESRCIMLPRQLPMTNVGPADKAEPARIERDVYTVERLNFLRGKGEGAAVYGFLIHEKATTEMVLAKMLKLTPLSQRAS